MCLHRFQLDSFWLLTLYPIKLDLLLNNWSNSPSKTHYELTIKTFCRFSPRNTYSKVCNCIKFLFFTLSIFTSAHQSRTAFLRIPWKAFPRLSRRETGCKMQASIRQRLVNLIVHCLLLYWGTAGNGHYFSSHSNTGEQIKKTFHLRIQKS